jgi:hypothetical protein
MLGQFEKGIVYLKSLVSSLDKPPSEEMATLSTAVAVLNTLTGFPTY